ncbi:MAG: tRNA pseudouridine(13) synthase TruD [Candidatus Omnitrophica bacterium]|nr:tRNA pseudouridine(13) synthase TruD [Candidatus Omnitrophota bacterium]
MKNKILFRLDDFIVEEKVSLPSLEAGPYTVYSIKKRGWNTVDAVRQLSQAWMINAADCAFGGKKDRHGETVQYITIKGGPAQCLELKNILVEFKGYTNRPMGSDAIEGNLFMTVVRNLTPEEASEALENAQGVAATGFVNYFDDQRFGGHDLSRGFLAEWLLKGHLNSALRAYLASSHPDDKKEEKERKAFLNAHWKDWQACLGVAKTSFEKRVFARLVNDPKGLHRLIEEIPSQDFHMSASVYQSFLWNEIVRRLLVTRKWASRFYKGMAGDYVFFEKINGRDYEYLKNMTLHHPADKVQMPDKILGKIYEKILAEREVQVALFGKLKTAKVFFKPTPRRVLVKPQETVFRVEDDEQNTDRKKIVLEFFLPRGSYATMFLKRIFASPLI